MLSSGELSRRSLFQTRLCLVLQRPGGVPMFLQAREEGSVCHRNRRQGQLHNVWDPGQNGNAGPLVGKGFPFLRSLFSCRIFLRGLSPPSLGYGDPPGASADPRRYLEPHPVAGCVSSSDPNLRQAPAKDGGRPRLLGWGGERAAENLPGEGWPQPPAHAPLFRQIHLDVNHRPRSPKHGLPSEGRPARMRRWP